MNTVLLRPFGAALLMVVAAGPARAAESLPAFNGVALWQEGDAAAQRYARGYVDPVERGAPLSTSMRFPAISITKLLTAVLVLQEVERGHLKLDAPIGPLWPQLKDPAVRALSPRQLLQHTSGLPNLDAALPEINGVSGYYARAPVAPAALQAEVLRLSHGPLAFPPGSRFAYNNLDYLLLGALLERRTRLPFAALVQTRILTPLGMEHSVLAGSRPAADLVPGGTEVDGRPTHPPRVYLQNFGPAGALLTTADDLARFANGLLDDRLLNRATRAELFRGNAQLGYVALGCWSYAFSDETLDAPVDVVERQGEAPGYRASLILVPSRHAVLILLTNTDTLDFQTWNPASANHRLLTGLLRGATLDALMPPLDD